MIRISKADEKCLLTVDEAIAMLDPNAEEIHVFQQPSGGVLLGADWGRKAVIDVIRSAVQREIGGTTCQSMNHGLVVWTTLTHPLYVECREGFDYAAFEAQIFCDDVDTTVSAE